MPTPSSTQVAAHWRLTTHHPDVDRVFFVREASDGLTTWMPMAPSRSAPGAWTLDVAHAPRPGRFRIYTVEAQSVINCGDADLSCRAISGPVTARAAS